MSGVRGLESGRRLKVTLLASAMMCLAVTSCSSGAPRGEATKSSKAILQDAIASLVSASSVHLSGTESVGGTLLTVNLVAGHSKGGGSISAGPLTFQIVLNGGSLYVDTDSNGWTQLGCKSQADELANRWVRTPASDPSAAGIAKVTNIDTWANQLEGSSVEKQAVTSVNGIEVVPLQSTNPDQSPAILYVSATGVPRLVGIRDVQSGGLMAYDQYGEARLPQAPGTSIPRPTNC